MSEEEALARFYGANGRKPLWTGPGGYNERADAVLREFAAAAAYGLRPEDFAVGRPNLAAATDLNEILADAELALTKAALKYARYAKGGRIDPRKLSRFQERGPLVPDYPALLEALATDRRPALVLRGEHPQHPHFEALRQKLLALGRNGDIADPSAEAREKERLLLLINMERWRWMPETLEGGNNLYVWANVPELHVRIVRDSQEVFRERAIVGLQGKQTPMFSDEMEWIEINPTWYIPDSIKVADILPNLRRNGSVVEKFHLRIDCGKHGRDHRTIDWKTVNIRSCAVTQPAGANSVLGNFKFKFPNRFSVYMHDTLNRNLFDQKTRVLSHGCVRVDNPRQMAELLLSHDKHPSAKRIDAILASGAQHSAHLRRKIPVHLTYFTAMIGEDGKLQTFPDYYGHDHRLAQAMFGRGRLFPVLAYAGSQSGRPRIPRPEPEAETLPPFYR